MIMDNTNSLEFITREYVSAKLFISRPLIENSLTLSRELSILMNIEIGLVAQVGLLPPLLREVPPSCRQSTTKLPEIKFYKFFLSPCFGFG